MIDQRASSRWGSLVEQLEQSGQSLSAFAAQHGVNPRTLSWWRWNLRRSSPATEPTHLVEASAVPSLDRTVILAFDDYRAHIVVDHDTDLELLRKLLETLC
jgi:transposase-like protein